MRIISQDGSIDLPYDYAVIYVHYRENAIYAGDLTREEGFPIGTYYSREDAEYVLKVIRRLYVKKYMYLRLPAADKVSELRNEMREE